MSEVSKAKITTIKMADLLRDEKNSNIGTQRGQEVLESSVREFGVAEAGTVDKNNRIVGGNKRFKTYEKVGIDDEVIVIEVDGKSPVYLKRNDIDLKTPEGRRLAHMLNRSHELSYDLDVNQLLDDIDIGVPLDDLWGEDELAGLFGAILQDADNKKSNAHPLGDKKKQIKPVLYAEEIHIFEQAIRAAGERNRGAALIKICEAYLGTKGQFDFNIESILETQLT